MIELWLRYGQNEQKKKFIQLVSYNINLTNSYTKRLVLKPTHDWLMCSWNPELERDHTTAPNSEHRSETVLSRSIYTLILFKPLKQGDYCTYRLYEVSETLHSAHRVYVFGITQEANIISTSTDDIPLCSNKLIHQRIIWPTQLSLYYKNICFTICNKHQTERTSPGENYTIQKNKWKFVFVIEFFSSQKCSVIRFLMN